MENPPARRTERRAPYWARRLGVVTLATFALAAIVTTRHPSKPSASERDRVDWQALVAALELVKDEYPEAREDESQARTDALTKLIDKRLDGARSGQTLHPDWIAELESLSRLMHDAREPKRVSEASSNLAKKIMAAPGFPRAPRAKPDREHGAQVFASACAACHGADGTGNPSVAETMNPKPPDILHPDVNNTPHEVFSRVTYGGYETAMPSFREALSEQDRWDVVFYLFAVRWAPCEKKIAAISVDKLAQSGDFELWQEYGEGAAPCLRRQY